MKKAILNSFLGAIVFCLTCLLVLYFVKARLPDSNGLTAQPGDVLTAEKRNNLVPAKIIIAVYDSICPTGRKPADGTDSTPDLRGQFIRGLNTFDGGSTTRTDGNQDPNGGSRTLGSYQADDFKSHIHISMSDYYNGGGSYAGGGVAGNTVSSGSRRNTYAAGGSETRPKNVAVIYCMKK